VYKQRLNKSKETF